MNAGRTLGRYELVSRIGSGSVERWLANQSGVGKLVEIRVVTASSTGPSVTEALDRARIVAQIEHGNLASVLDVGTVDDIHFVVTEHLEGETLASLLEAGRNGRRLDELGIARVLADVAEGLDAAHDHVDASGTPYQLLHRRLSPSTVIVLYNGQVKVVALDALGAGPLAYAAPERVDDDATTGDRRGDVFALGALLWEALTAERLFDPEARLAPEEAKGDDAVKRLVRHLEIVSPAELNANVPAPLADVALRALARDPAQRQQTAKHVALGLEEVLTQASYSRRNDRIARYMTEVFAGQIAARRERSGKVTMPPLARPAAASAPPPNASATAIPAIAPRPTPAPAPRPTPAPTVVVGPVVVAPAPVAQAAAAPAASPAPTPVTNLSQTIMGVVANVRPADASHNGIRSNGDTTPSLRQTMPFGSVAGFATASAVEPEAAAPPPEPPPPPVLPAPVDPVEHALPIAQALPAVEPVSTLPPPLSGPPEMPPPLPVAEPPRRAPTNSDGVPRRAESQGDPLAVVSLPDRSSKNVVDGWDWKSGSVPALRDDDDNFEPPPSSRRALFIAIGAAAGVIGFVIVAALAMGGSSEENKPVKTAALPTLPDTPSKPTTPQPAVDPTAGSGSADSGSAENAGSAAAPGSADSAVDSGSAGSAQVLAGLDPSAAGSAGSATTSTSPLGSATAPAPGHGSATPAVATQQPPTPPTPPAPHPPPVPARPAPPPPHEAPHSPAPPPRVAKKPDPKPVDPYATPAHADKPKPNKVDADAAYKAGFQAFVHGDNAAALTSLRQAVSANPNYAAAWRVLGLVLERMGEHDQAKSAFRRYLALAPTAGDADQIRDRMEKL